MNIDKANPGRETKAHKAAEVSAGTPAANGGTLTADPVAAILDVLRKGERFVVCSHSRPDGDAVGSVLAMRMLLEQMGKRADLVSADRIPSTYRTLPGAEFIRSALRVRGPYDAAILLECDGLDRTRLLGLDKFFQINIDHHISGRAFAQINWIDCAAASVGEMVYRLALAAGATITADMAACLYTTVLTDTGGFCYGSTQASTFSLAHELVVAGANPIRIAQDVYFSTTVARLLLLGTALRHLKREGPVAWLWITHQEMIRTCAAEEDCEGIVNYALAIAGVEAAVFVRELPEERVRVSLRSKGKVDVAAIAERLGGGGHENAAGCTLEGPLPRALGEIFAELRRSAACFPASAGLFP